MRLVVDLNDLDLHLLANVEHFGRMIDAPPGNVRDVQQAVDAAEVDEGAVVGDVLHHAVDYLTLFEVLHQFLTLLGARLLQHGAAGDDDVAASAIHLQDLERWRYIHQRRDVADRADVYLAARQKGHRAVKIDGEAALDLVEDDALDLLVALERGLELAPTFLGPRRRNFGLGADLPFGLPARTREFAQRRASFGLGAEIDDSHVLFDADNL